MDGVGRHENVLDHEAEFLSKPNTMLAVTRHGSHMGWFDWKADCHWLQVKPKVPD